jgi:hypothetical protein
MVIAASAAAGRKVTIKTLIREFGRRFWFGTIEVQDHVSHMAIRRGGASEPGLQVVITPDVREMADALRQDQQDSPPGGLPPAAGPGDAGRRPG